MVFSYIQGEIASFIITIFNSSHGQQLLLNNIYMQAFKLAEFQAVRRLLNLLLLYQILSFKTKIKNLRKQKTDFNDRVQ